MTRILFTETYNKKASKFIKKHPEIIKLYEKTLLLVEANIYHPSLRLHKLKGPLDNLHSISINLSYRITIYFLIKDDTVIPIEIGSHDEVY
jgi:mRNA-degrading endonuclease YafQ of YafQ-DinJ toxin-antitoxin module